MFTLFRVLIGITMGGFWSWIVYSTNLNGAVAAMILGWAWVCGLILGILAGQFQSGGSRPWGAAITVFLLGALVPLFILLVGRNPTSTKQGGSIHVAASNMRTEGTALGTPAPDGGIVAAERPVSEQMYGDIVASEKPVLEEAFRDIGAEKEETFEAGKRAGRETAFAPPKNYGRHEDEIVPVVIGTGQWSISFEMPGPRMIETKLPFPLGRVYYVSTTSVVPNIQIGWLDKNGMLKLSGASAESFVQSRPFCCQMMTSCANDAQLVFATDKVPNGRYEIIVRQGVAGLARDEYAPGIKARNISR
jgi:hypothetical protein